VCGIVGAIFGLIPILFFIALPLGLLAIIFGFVGRGRANRDPNVGRKRMATWGIVSGVAAVVLGCIGIAIVNDAFDQFDKNLNSTQRQINKSDRQLSPSLNPQRPQADQGAAPGAVAIVRHYYNAVNRGSYDEAWALLSPALQDRLGGSSTWREGYRFTESTEVTDVHRDSATSSAVTVGLGLRATDLDVCGDKVTQTFAGAWEFARSGGGLQANSFSMDKVSGGTPERDPSACASQATPAPPAAACDPNYSGACLDPNSADYDCQGGSGDGPDYTGPVTIVGDDPYGLDADGNNLGCEPY
jgi:hypothetical protein